jgi:hypothetical protein
MMIADARVHQPARREAVGVGDVAFHHLRIEGDVGIGRELVDLERPAGGAVHDDPRIKMQEH